MDAQAQTDLAAETRRNDLRMARTLLDLYLQLQLADDQIWPLLAGAAAQPQHNLQALVQAVLAHERPPS